jgi:2-methylisocitrate lyase-like PEP mutase family enzyme
MAYADQQIIDRFHKLHEAGCFVIANPWDIGSARYLGYLGFQALATTSAGFAFSMGEPDGEGGIGLDQMLAHIASIVAAVPDRPVNADFQSGYAHDPEGVATNVKRCLETGVAGLSIEDNSGEAEAPLYPVDLAVERIVAARRAIDESGRGVLLTARAECFLVGHSDPLNESIGRLQAYAEAGADVLYAPGPRSADHIKAIIDAVAPKPVNVLMSRPCGLTVSAVGDLGARRISVGSGLALAAWGGFQRAARSLLDGSFEAFADNAPYADVNGLFQRRDRR